LVGVGLRGLAIFLAAFTLVGSLGELRGGVTDIGLWFVDLTDLPRALRVVLFAGLGLVLLVWATRAQPGRATRRIAALACLLFAAFALRDVLRFAAAVDSGLVRPAVPLPLSLPVATALVVLGLRIWRDPGVERGGTHGVRLGVVAVAAALALAFPVAQIAFFGTTDYRRSADAAVVFGARVYANGNPSPLLADRIATSVDLYRAGLVDTIVMSGGDGADGFNEAAVMRDVAVAAGVPTTAILVDPSGTTTEATVDHAVALLRGSSAGPLRLIAVSQAYHLPRIQLAFSALGVDVLTVPAVDPLPIGDMPILIAREVPAFWLYYLRACLG
jgi:vancomycin permeability regulator SanA